MFKTYLVVVCICISLLVTGCSKPSSNQNSSNISANLANNINVLTDTNQSNEDPNTFLYHKYFDLSDAQKNEIEARGFSKEQIAILDKQDYDQMSLSWNLSDKQIEVVKNIYPELKNVDISQWTNEDFDKYSIAQDNKTYAPTPKQQELLNEKGFSLELARKMLKEYHTYDNLLLQSDEVLNELKTKIMNADKQYYDFVKYKAEIRAKYKKVYKVV